MLAELTDLQIQKKQETGMQSHSSTRLVADLVSAVQEKQIADTAAEV